MLLIKLSLTNACSLPWHCLIPCNSALCNGEQITFRQKLAFLGEVSHAKAQVLQQQAGRISQSDFNVTLDDIGHWPGSGVVWLGCKNPPRGLLQLAQLLRSQAARSGCYQTPQPFHPHVSLFRGAIRPVAIPAKTTNESFRADHFSLYESVYARGRTRYNMVQSWPLADSE